jgi:hypothetical protein
MIRRRSGLRQRVLRLLHATIWIALSADLVQAGSGMAGRWPDNVPEPKALDHGIEPRVANGAPSFERRVVAIFFHDLKRNRPNENSICSGLLISRHYIVTAAHCACDGINYKVTNEQAIRNPDALWRKANVVSVFSRRVCGGPGELGGDLALLKIEEPLAANELGRVCAKYSLMQNLSLAAFWINKAPPSLTVAGYGFDGNAVGSVGLRRQADLAVNSLHCLKPIYRALGCAPFNEFVLGAGHPSRLPKDSCGGDSGGPVFVKRDNELLPIGIVSRALPIPQPYSQLGDCGAGGIYTHLGRMDVIQWLRRSGVPDGTETCGTEDR